MLAARNAHGFGRPTKTDCLYCDGEWFPQELLMTLEQYAWFVDKATDALDDLHGRLKIVVKWICYNLKRKK